MAGNGRHGDDGGGQKIVRGKQLSDNLAGIRSVVKRGGKRGMRPLILPIRKWRELSVGAGVFVIFKLKE